MKGIREYGTNGNNGTNGISLGFFRLFRYFRLFRILYLFGDDHNRVHYRKKSPAPMKIRTTTAAQAFCLSGIGSRDSHRNNFAAMNSEMTRLNNSTPRFFRFAPSPAPSFITLYSPSTR